MHTPFSCDTSVALGSATADGSTIFAKNSDRTPNEAQPLSHYPRTRYPAGATVRCQYIEIPQVEETWEIIGSRPAWLWGFEIGVNEWGVTIGNEAVMTREPDEDLALIGMDLIRLALERASSASEATDVITELIERYGQGGSCEEFSHRTYHNSFIVADPGNAFIIETAGHRWVTRRVLDKAAIGNLLTIDTPDTSSPGLIEHADRSGWGTSPFSFAESYRDPEIDLSTRTCRFDRSRQILGEHPAGAIGVRDMIALLSDHNHGDLPAGSVPLPTLCVHANPVFPGETAAAMVAHLRPNRPKELSATIWTAFGSPCLSLFRPVYPFAVGLPQELDIGNSRYSVDSPWWIFERFQRMIAASPELAPQVRSVLAPVQEAFFASADTAEKEAEQLILAGRSQEARSVLRGLVDETTTRSIALFELLTEQFTGECQARLNPEMASFWAEMNAKAGVALPGFVQVSRDRVT